MRIILVSRSWPAYETSGVSLAAQKHVNLLDKAGHDVFILGSNPNVVLETARARDRFYISSAGSGALYSPIRVDKKQLQKMIKDIAPDLVIVEAWQTALTEVALKLSTQMHIPTLMISHGISIHPFTHTIRDWLRSIAWWPYRFFQLPAQIARLSAITTLDLQSKSARFYDRDLAMQLQKPVIELGNAPMHYLDRILSRSERKSQVLCIGYYSPVKNQLGALKVLTKLPPSISAKFIGKKGGSYYEQCLRFAIKHHLLDRVQFLNQEECNIAQEIAHSMALLQCSITEALPITLIESMACGTPFVASAVGAAPSMRGGILADTESAQAEGVLRLFEDSSVWWAYSRAGILDYQQRFNDDAVNSSLLRAVDCATQSGTRRKAASGE